MVTRLKGQGDQHINYQGSPHFKVDHFCYEGPDTSNHWLKVVKAKYGDAINFWNHNHPTRSS